MGNPPGNISARRALSEVKKIESSRYLIAICALEPNPHFHLSCRLKSPQCMAHSGTRERVILGAAIAALDVNVAPDMLSGLLSRRQCALGKVLTAVGRQTAAGKAWSSDLPLSYRLSAEIVHGCACICVEECLILDFQLAHARVWSGCMCR